VKLRAETFQVCYREGVKTLPPPAVPGNTDAERMDNAVRRMFTVSKADVLRREAEERLRKLDNGARLKKKR
jgi:hypothetical protein